MIAQPVRGLWKKSKLTEQWEKQRYASKAQSELLFSNWSQSFGLRKMPKDKDPSSVGRGWLPKPRFGCSDPIGVFRGNTLNKLISPERYSS